MNNQFTFTTQYTLDNDDIEAMVNSLDDDLHDRIREYLNEQTCVDIDDIPEDQLNSLKKLIINLLYQQYT